MRKQSIKQYQLLFISSNERTNEARVRVLLHTKVFYLIIAYLSTYVYGPKLFCRAFSKRIRALVLPIKSAAMVRINTTLRYLLSIACLSAILSVNLTSLGPPHSILSDDKSFVGERAKQTVKPRDPALDRESNQRVKPCDNPFRASLTVSLDTVLTRMEEWLQTESYLGITVVSEGNSADHRRFRAFTELSGCNVTCVGGDCDSDESKQVCGLELLKAPCVIYSVGGNNMWAFEEDLLAKTECEVHTFDCTGPLSRFTAPVHERLHFHHVCIVSPDTRSRDSNMEGQSWTLQKAQNELGHSQIDLLKMDIEGFEWPILTSWPELSEGPDRTRSLPMQVLVEVHYRTHMTDLGVEGHDFKFATDMMRLSRHMNLMGYFTAINAYNPHCPHCTELTLVRARCASECSRNRASAHLPGACGDKSEVPADVETSPTVYLDSLIRKCGKLCKINEGTFKDSLFFEKRTVQFDCKAIFSDDVFIMQGHEQATAPEEMPEKFVPDYTLNGQIPVKQYYFDQMYLSKTANTPVWEKEMVEEWIELAKNDKLEGNYGTGETLHLKNGLKVANNVRSGRVLVIGSENPWVEAVVLSVGATEVVTLEYGKIVSKHPLIKTMTPDQFKREYIDGTLGLFDAIVTFSSVEHSGLGRYGDALNPWGDVLEIARAHCVCKPNGSLVIAVPNDDENDVLEFNAHRIYGRKRWPYLASNWQQVHRESSAGSGSWEQTVYVFAKV